MHLVLNDSAPGPSPEIGLNCFKGPKLRGWYIFTIVALGIVAQGFLAVNHAQAQQTGVSKRDSLLQEVRRYSQVVTQLRDSLSAEESDFSFSSEQQLGFESSIDEISEIISEISGELGRFSLEIEDNRLSFVDEAGKGINIQIPDDLGEHLGAGLDHISHLILEQVPDTLSFSDDMGDFDWRQFIPNKPPPPRRVAHGNLIKFWDDVQVTDEDDVRGNVIVTFGNSEISGRVDGNVIVLFGDLLLSDTAEVTGRVINILGRLDQSSDAKVGDLLVINPWDGPARAGGWLADGGLTFLTIQIGFLLSTLFTLIIFGVVPGKRLDSILLALNSGPTRLFSTGFMAALGGHLISLIMIAILVLTVIGIPLALIVALALIFLYLLAVGVVAGSIGKRLCQYMHWCESRKLFQIVTGLLILNLCVLMGSIGALIPALSGIATILMLVGYLVVLVAYIVGLGAIAQSRFGTRI